MTNSIFLSKFVSAIVREIVYTHLHAHKAEYIGVIGDALLRLGVCDW